MKKLMTLISTLLTIAALQFSIAAFACENCPQHKDGKPAAECAKHKDCKHRKDCAKCKEGNCDKKDCPHHKAMEEKNAEQKAE